ncbi:MAG: patatin-like phospholipase family protein [Muribaculaceae bacterium]|nr:patatin-like phospholipase family protein [Muribaculaceae bacterium]
MGKIGLVFGGGGSRGAYQIGMWKAMKDLGIDEDINMVSGTSVGALNAVLFALGDYQSAFNIW